MKQLKRDCHYESCFKMNQGLEELVILENVGHLAEQGRLLKNKLYENTSICMEPSLQMMEHQIF